MTGKEFMKVMDSSVVVQCEDCFCKQCEVSVNQQTIWYTLKPPYKFSFSF